MCWEIFIRDLEPAGFFLIYFLDLIVMQFDLVSFI